MVVPPKVCHLTSVHAPLDDRIYYREGVTLASAGYHVVIVAPAERDEVVDGIRLRAIAKPKRRVERMTKTAWSAYRTGLSENADIYHLHDPELLPFGFLLRMCGKRVIYDAHEDAPDDLMTKDWIPGWLHGPLAYVLNGLMYLAGLFCSGVVAATPRIAARFPGKRTVVVANYPNVDEVCYATTRPLAERPGNAVYVGSLTQIRGVLEMVEAFADSAVPVGARLIIGGTFGDFGDASFERGVRSLPGWQRVDFRGWRSRPDVFKDLSCAQVGLVVLHPQRSFVNALPAKLFEYMAAALPVIASNFPLWREIIEGAGCGILVDPLDPAAIANAIGFLLNNPQKAEAMGLRGRQAAFRKYNWSAQADRLLELYKVVLDRATVMAVGHV